MKGVKELIKLVTAVCAQDGIISQIELETSFKLIKKIDTKLSKKDFDLCIEEFFDEEKNIEKYLIAMPENLDSDLVISICLQSAQSDGLEIRENFAFDKICKFWGKSNASFIK